jgi:hypothetical protein
MTKGDAYPGLGADTADSIDPDIFGHEFAPLVKAHVLHELLPPEKSA